MSALLKACRQYVEKEQLISASLNPHGTVGVGRDFGLPSVFERIYPSPGFAWGSGRSRQVRARDGKGLGLQRVAVVVLVAVAAVIEAGKDY